MNKTSLRILRQGVRLEQKGFRSVSPTYRTQACNALSLPQNTPRAVVSQKLDDAINKGSTL